MIDRRSFIGALAAMLASAPAAMARTPLQGPVQVQGFRAPDCGCCEAWIAHLEENGFPVEDTLSVHLDEIKDRLGIPVNLRSCHTALVEDYIIEGHVPAKDIRCLLEKRPTATMLAVPGMPIGSPGMEMGERVAPFEVILWTGSGTQIFSQN